MITPELREKAIASMRDVPDEVITIALIKCIAGTLPDTPPENVFIAVNAVVNAIREAARQDALSLLTVPGVQ